MFRVVTVGREYASGGSAIARMVAKSLGWRLWDRSLIEAVADQAQVDVGATLKYDEAVDSWLRMRSCSTPKAWQRWRSA